MTKPKRKPATAVVAFKPRLPAPPKSMLEVILRASTNPKCDPAKMQALLDMQERIEARAAKREFDQAYLQLQRDLPSIRRDGRIVVRAKDKQTGERDGRVLQSTPYAQFDDIHAVVMPILFDHGFSLGYETYSAPLPNDPMRMMLKAILSRNGHERISEFPIIPDPTGSKNIAQGHGSGQSYAKRYTTVAVLNIRSHAPQDRDRDGYAPTVIDDPPPPKPSKKSTPPADSDFPGDRPMKDDPISSGPERISQAQHDQLTDCILDCGVGMKAVYDKYRIKTLADLPASLYEDVVAACKNYRAAKEAHGR